METSKLCPKCNVEKQSTDFYKKGRWLSPYCRACSRLWYEEYRSSKKGKETRRQRSKNDYQKNRLQYQARAKVAQALRMGRITRPETCEDCFAAVETPQAHHDDYNMPLSVNWLCKGCHLKRHNRLVSVELIGK